MLTFRELQEKSIKRSEEAWAHKPSEYIPAQWLRWMSKKLKKLEKMAFTGGTSHEWATEVAHMVIYSELLCQTHDRDLGHYIVTAFNDTSDKKVLLSKWSIINRKTIASQKI